MLNAEEVQVNLIKFAPVVDQESLWDVGSRLKNFVLFTFERKLPVLPLLLTQVKMAF